MSELGSIDGKFIEENSKQNLVKPRKKFAPYTKGQRAARRKKVYRLHFELGYPAVRIAELMKVDKNTINNDIQLLYKELGKEFNKIPYEEFFAKHIARLDGQRSRLLEQLEKCKDFEQKLSVEKMVLDIDSRLLQTTSKLYNNNINVWQTASKALNNYAENKKLNYRFTTPFELYEVSDKARMKIDKILKEG